MERPLDDVLSIFTIPTSFKETPGVALGELGKVKERGNTTQNPMADLCYMVPREARN